MRPEHLDKFVDPIASRDAQIAELEGDLESALTIIEALLAGVRTPEWAKEQLEIIRARRTH